jgi:hypothetical protein
LLPAEKSRSFFYSRQRINIKEFLASFSLLFTLLLLFIISPVFSSNPYQSYFNQKAYGDGLTQENLPPASVGDRQASLFVKINPAILTTENKGNAFIQFRLFDAKDNRTFEHVTYEITLRKGAGVTTTTTTPASDQKPLLRDFFHAHNGLLTLKIRPSNGTLIINADQEPFQNAWVADPGGSISIKGPILLEGGLYNFEVSVFGIDNDRNLFIPENAPKFNSSLSVGDIYHYNVTDKNNKKYNLSLISYYDKIRGLNFVPANNTLSWAMPFNWNLDRLKNVKIFVHEEISIPRSADFTASRSYSGTVNGVDIPKNLMIDTTKPEKDVIHFMLPKDRLIQMAEQMNKNGQESSNGLMKFTLQPGDNSSSNRTKNAVSTS